MRFAIGAAIERNMILTALIDRAGNAFGEKMLQKWPEYSTFLSQKSCFLSFLNLAKINENMKNPENEK